MSATVNPIAKAKIRGGLIAIGALFCFQPKVDLGGGICAAVYLSAIIKLRLYVSIY